MSKIETKAEDKRQNPFLTDKADALWEKLKKNGKSVTKEDLVRRSKALKKNGGKF